MGWAEFDKVIMGLRVFKPGPVGYESIRFRTVKFFPASFGLVGRHGFLPFDRYHISRAETEPMAIWVKMIFAVSEQAIELACSRLSDAETRSEPRDRVLDAVIGLESLLLAGLPKEDRRGELRFRFSLNYSTLFEPKERYHAFRVAKDLYDLRSSIAHGGVPKGDTWRIGDEKSIPHQAARRAAEALRFVIQFFLPEASAAPYKNPQYWENRYFGQEESRVAESHCE